MINLEVKGVDFYHYKDLNAEERKEFDKLLDCVAVPYASTATFEKEKYRNYKQALHLRDLMFLFFRENLVKSNEDKATEDDLQALKEIILYT
uniref:Type I site-specific deoxyribonuclease n=1 Tax=Rhabditophanes sp. KR3021 TaxID=114890 RepID=A0AC35TS14_9BILA